VLCEIARQIKDDQLEQVRTLEHDLGLTLVAFRCRSLEPEREEKLREIMEQLGLQIQAPLDEPDQDQLDRIRAAEDALGLALVAVRS
jgi:hypothetical protein